MSRGRGGAKPQTPLLDGEHAQRLGLDLEEVGDALDPESMFGRRAPFDIDFGAGKGHFLVAYAAANPERDVLAVERAEAYHLKELERAVKRGLDNLRCLCARGEDLVERLAPASVSRFFVYHPDPWPKARHHKRRFVAAKHLETLAPKLVPGGLVVIQTDHDGYAEWMREEIPQAGSYEALPTDAFFAELPPSGFELKHRDLGKTIHRFLLQRR